MASDKRKLKQCPFGSLAFRQLWRHQMTSAKGRKIQKDKRKSKQAPVGTGRRVTSSLRRCSNQPSESGKEDTTFSQSEKTVDGKSNTCSVSAADKKVVDEDTTLSQHVKTANDKANSRPLAEDMKVGDEDTKLSRPGNTVSDNLKPRPPFPKVHRFCDRSAKELVKQRLHKGGVMQRVLSPAAAKLYKEGMPLKLAVSSVGYKNAFTPWRDNRSICVKLRVERGSMVISKSYPF